MQGHIDGTSELLSVTEGSAWRVLRFSLTPELAPLVARKGSIAIDGVSLTVSAVGTDWFEVSLIPETLTATTLGAKAPGDRVNIETDILARHVARMQEFQVAPDRVRPVSEGVFGHIDTGAIPTTSATSTTSTTEKSNA